MELPSYRHDPRCQGCAQEVTVNARRRRLPAEQVIWLVLGMALYRDQSIKQIVEHLRLACR